MIKNSSPHAISDDQWTGPLADSHCHLIKVHEFDAGLVSTLEAYPQRRILDVGIYPDDWDARLALFSSLSGIYFSAGVHPSMYGHVPRAEAKAHLERIFSQDARACAVGETGLDWHAMYAPKHAQYEYFEMQLELAARYGKPVIIHARSGADGDAIESVLERLANVGYSSGGVMHCFSGTTGQAKKCLDLGLYVSFSANISYASAEAIREAARVVPAEYLLAETDAPYLLHKKAHARTGSAAHSDGQNKKGRYNHPAYLPLTYETLASIRSCASMDIAQAVYDALGRLLGLAR